MMVVVVCCCLCVLFVNNLFYLPISPFLLIIISIVIIYNYLGEPRK